MGRPQQPELARSGRTDLDPDRIGTELEARKEPVSKGRTGPVPPENQPGHRSAEEADKPDLDDFAAKLGAGDPPAPAPSTDRPATAGPSVAGRQLPGVPHLAASGLRFAGRTLGGVQEWLTARWRARQG